MAISRTSRSIGGILTILLLACTAAESQNALGAPRDGLRTQVLGCYALYTPGGKLLDSTFYNSSPMVRLDSAAMGITGRDTVPGVFRTMVRLNGVGAPWDPVDRQGHFGRVWWADSLSDSIRLSFSDGFSGAQVILAVPNVLGDTLFGRIEEHWDMGPTVNQRGRVRALRVRCRGAA